MPSMHTCPRCQARTAAADCCGVVFARRRRWRMTAKMVSRVHALALGQKGLNYETYRLRLQAVGVKSSKNFSRAQYVAFMRGLATLPDVAPKRVSLAQDRQQEVAA